MTPLEIFLCFKGARVERVTDGDGYIFHVGSEKYIADGLILSEAINKAIRHFAVKAEFN